MPFCTVSAQQSRKGNGGKDPALETVKIYYRTYGQGDSKIMMIMGVAATNLAWWPQVKPLAGTDVPNEPDDPEGSSSDDEGACPPALNPWVGSSSDEDSSGSSSAGSTEALRCKSDLGHRLMVHGAESLACHSSDPHAMRLPPILSPRLAPSPGGSGASLAEGEGEQEPLAAAAGAGAEEQAPGGAMRAPVVFDRLDGRDGSSGSSNSSGRDGSQNGGHEEGKAPAQGKGSHGQKLTGRVVCVFDNRGVGRSSHPVDPKNYRTDIMARDVLALADKLGWERFHVIGHSMGGMIACKLAAIAPLRVKSLAIISASTGGLDILPRLEMRTWNLVARMLQAHTPEDRASVDLDTHFSESFLSEMVDGRPRRHHLHREYVRTLTSKGALQPKHAQNGQLSACWNHGLTAADVQHICEANIPTSIIHGSDDVVAHVSLGERLARRLHEVARFVELYGGHMIIRERVEEVNQSLIDLVTAAQDGVRGRAWVAADKHRDETDLRLETCTVWMASCVPAFAVPDTSWLCSGRLKAAQHLS